MSRTTNRCSMEEIKTNIGWSSRDILISDTECQNWATNHSEWERKRLQSDRVSRKLL